ncbi:MAG: COX15/CtaA family protein [Caulobacteraceae bacterium]|nr:COX15/CtaA family protein [Caulobacteraceae bacterium]
MNPLSNDGRSRGVAAWLFAVALLVLAMVVVGGATRLTGSGLSITQWKPVAGALPPMTGEAWARDFARYRATPQYRVVNHGMSLGEFKFIFWWEWAHRLLGRLVGVAFAVPYIIFLATRRLSRRLVWRCGALLGLGVVQGAIGWWMVQSGLENRVAVAPERLATHLGLGLLLFCGLIWVGLESWAGRGVAAPRRRDGWTLAAAGFAIGVFTQCLIGALVAGNRAGLIDNDWPLMAGRLFPADYWQGSFWATLAHGLAAVQFNHRLLAYGLAAAGTALALAAARAPTLSPAIRRLWFAVVAVLFLQVAIGVTTLVAGAPLPLALAHQANAALLLACATALAWRSRRI